MFLLHASGSQALLFVAAVSLACAGVADGEPCGLLDGNFTMCADDEYRMASCLIMEEGGESGKCIKYAPLPGQSKIDAYYVKTAEGGKLVEVLKYSSYQRKSMVECITQGRVWSSLLVRSREEDPFYACEAMGKRGLPSIGIETETHFARIACAEMKDGTGEGPWLASNVREFSPAAGCTCAHPRMGTFMYTSPIYDTGPYGNVPLLLVTYDMFTERSTGIMEIVSGAVDATAASQTKVAYATINMMNHIKIAAARKDNEVQKAQLRAYNNDFTYAVPVRDVASSFNKWVDGRDYNIENQKYMFRLNTCADNPGVVRVIMTTLSSHRNHMKTGVHVNFGVTLSGWQNTLLFQKHFSGCKASLPIDTFLNAQMKIRKQIPEIASAIAGVTKLRTLQSNALMGFLINLLSFFTFKSWFAKANSADGPKGILVNEKNAWGQMFKTPLQDQFRMLDQETKAVLMGWISSSPDDAHDDVHDAHDVHEVHRMVDKFFQRIVCSDILCALFGTESGTDDLFNCIMKKKIGTPTSTVEKAQDMCKGSFAEGLGVFRVFQDDGRFDAKGRYVDPNVAIAGATPGGRPIQGFFINDEPAIGVESRCGTLVNALFTVKRFPGRGPIRFSFDLPKLLYAISAIRIQSGILPEDATVAKRAQELYDRAGAVVYAGIIPGSIIHIPESFALLQTNGVSKYRTRK